MRFLIKKTVIQFGTSNFRMNDGMMILREMYVPVVMLGI